MATSLGTRHHIFAATAWAIAVIVAACGFLHSETLSAGAERLFRLPRPATTQALQSVVAEKGITAPTVAVVEIPVGRSGHFRAQVEINGQPVAILVDTGATMVALSYEDAQRAGLHLTNGDFTHSVATANGTARVAKVVLDKISVGSINVRDVQAAVSEPGGLRTSLLGLSFLDRLSRFDMRPDLLVLQK